MIAAWLAAANPFRSNPTRVQALMAARWSSIALIISAAVGLTQALLVWINRERTIAAMREFMETFSGAATAGTSPEFAEMHAAMMEAMMPGVILQSVVWGVLFTLVYLGLAAVQWSKPTRWIPIVFLVFAGFSLFGYLSDALMMSAFENAAATMPDGSAMPMPGPEMTGIPAWFLTVTAVKSALVAILHITGLRGALALRRMAERNPDLA